MEKASKANCDLCTLCANPFVPSECHKGALIAAIAEAPGLSEVNIGRPLVGQAGQELDFIIAKVGSKRDKINFLNACDCRPMEGKENRTPTESEIDCCRARLEYELLQLKPLVIVCLGVSPYYSLFGKKPRKFTDVVGTEAEWKGIRVLITNHPAKILHEGGHGSALGKITKDAIENAMDKAVKLTTDRQLILIDDVPKDAALADDAPYTMLEELKRRCHSWFGNRTAVECKSCTLRFYCYRS